VLIYNYGGVSPRQLNKNQMLKFIQREMDPKNGMRAFNEYAAWKLEVEIYRESRQEEELKCYQPLYPKKRLVQYRLDNTLNKIPLLNTYVCWLLLWCGTLAYQDPDERDF
jgi:hypothetical protein